MNIEDILQKLEIWFIPVSILVTFGSLGLYFKGVIEKNKERIAHNIEIRVNGLLEKEVRSRLKNYGIVEYNIPSSNHSRPFNKDPKIGLLEIFSFYSSNALPFIGYYHVKSGIDPIVYDKRLTDDENTRFLKNLGDIDKGLLYKEKTKKFQEIINWLNGQLIKLQQGVLERAILDLEHGGVFYYRVSQYEYLFGICLNQLMIHQADREMRILSRNTQEYLGVNISWN